MKILIVSEYFPESSNAERKGGAESRAFYMARELAKNNELIVICSYQPENKSRINKFDKLTVYRVGPKIPYAHSGNVFRRILFCIAASLKGLEIKTDLIDSYSFLAYNIAAFISFFKRVPKIATYHETWVGEWMKNKPGFTGFMGEIFERATLKFKWSAIVSVSDFTKGRLLKAGAKAKIIETVHNGIETLSFNKIRNEEKKNKYDKTTIVCVARLTPKKRVIDLIEALPKIKEDIQNINCKIIGVGNEKEKIEKRIKELKLENCVELLGFVEKYEDVQRIIARSHLFCLPSELEGFGMVIVESMALGVPYVASDIAPIKEVTHNGKGGLLFRVRNVEDLAAKAVLLLKDKNICDEKKEEQENLISNYDWKYLAKDLENIYKEVLRK